MTRRGLISRLSDRLLTLLLATDGDPIPRLSCRVANTQALRLPDDALLHRTTTGRPASAELIPHDDWRHQADPRPVHTSIA